MTIRSKSVDKAFKLIRDGIEKTQSKLDKCPKNSEIYHVYSLKHLILLNIREEFDEYMTLTEEQLKSTPVIDIFPLWITPKIHTASHLAMVGGQSGRALYNFKWNIMRKILEKYYTLV